MNRSVTSILGALALMGLITGCGGRVGAPSTPQIVALQATAPQNKTLATASGSALSSYTSQSFDLFEAFCARCGPVTGSLISVNGTLYGTTPGGRGGHLLMLDYPGTVFSVSPSGTERVLYRFKGGTDGAYPSSGLLAVNGAFYGTTAEGGANGAGTVFSVSPSGTERVLYSFGGSDGLYPTGGLLAVNGALYGTTQFGGTNGNGTVFSVSPSGRERVLYRFKGGSDGSVPTASLLAVNGALYGTTSYGGIPNADDPLGLGTVFSVSPSGTERVLHRFKGGVDGAYPYAGLVVVNGALYGTTPGYGTSSGTISNGTVFSVSPSGAERVLYRFKGGTDGDRPQAGLITVNGALYGTTNAGGTLGAGTVFEVSTSGTERVLYSFKGRPDGADPDAGLIAVNGALYGTTNGGGTLGAGTVFALSLLRGYP